MSIDQHASARQRQPAFPPLQAIVWDMDGVIIDSSRQHLRSWQVLAEETNVTFTEADFWRTFGTNNTAIISQYWGAQLSAEQIAALAERKEVAFRELLKDDLHALPGALELMQAAHAAGLKQSLASSAPMENIAVISAGLGLERWLNAIVSGDRLARGKPAPDVFLLAAERLGVAPAGCVVIEDAPAGIAAAQAAGMRCLAVTNSHPAATLADANRVVDSLADVRLADLETLRGR
jgi:beta-phosphoglucomutase